MGDWALWAIEQRVVVLMCDFGEGGKEEYAGVIGLFGGNRLVLLLKRPFMATLESSHECQHSRVQTKCAQPDQWPIQSM